MLSQSAVLDDDAMEIKSSLYGKKNPPHSLNFYPGENFSSRVASSSSRQIQGRLIKIFIVPLFANEILSFASD